MARRETVVVDFPGVTVAAAVCGASPFVAATDEHHAHRRAEQKPTLPKSTGRRVSASDAFCVTSELTKYLERTNFINSTMVTQLV